MAKKIIPSDGHGNALNHPSIKSRAKHKPWVQSEYVTNYILERDRILWKICDQGTKDKLKDKYGK